MKHLTLTLFVLLLIAGSLAAGNAQIIYQDNFTGNDYSSRYADQNPLEQGWYNNNWLYTTVGGNSCLEPPKGPWPGAINTTAVDGGNFRNTSYLASVGILFQTNNSPYFDLTLLNNGYGRYRSYYPLVLRL